MSRGEHGKYTHFFLCRRCSFAIKSVYWRRHWRLCRRIPDGTRCEFCWDELPCRKKGCPKLEKLEEVDANEWPTSNVVRSLGMKVTRLPDGRWAIRTRDIDGPVIRDTWLEAYYAVLGAK